MLRDANRRLDQSMAKKMNCVGKTFPILAWEVTTNSMDGKQEKAF
jgi:hypothetical protein